MRAAALIILSLVLTACRTGPSDAKIREKLVGTWIADEDSSRTVEARADGSYVTRFTFNRTNAIAAQGRWQVRNGFVFAMMTNATALWPGATFVLVSNKVVSIDDRKLVFEGRGGGTNTLSLHRK